MSIQYKENNFSTENISTSNNISKNNKTVTARPNIDHLIKRIMDERRQQKKTNAITLGIVLLSIISIFYFS
jgi:hypothetical protein|tara:strand:- start:147 stop:359 length:213 start_codon:yes stop_codon:yes gene_type:complete